MAEQVFSLLLDGGRREVRVSGSQLRRVHDRIVRTIAGLAHGVRFRLVVLLAGPPGSGKSTLAALWTARAKSLHVDVPFQALSMDGFHLPNRELEGKTARSAEGPEVPLLRMKGVPESYDIELLRDGIRRLRARDPLAWPLYDRTVHDPVPGAIAVVPQGAIIVEGNFLLLDEPGFRDLRELADVSIFIECGEELTRSSILARLRRGGRDRADAQRHVDEVDAENWKRVMARRREADVVLRAGPRRGLEVVRWRP